MPYPSTTRRGTRAPACALLALCLSLAGSAGADGSGPRLAAYYDGFMAICAGEAFEWSGDDTPRAVMREVRAVGVGKANRYALTTGGVLLGWSEDPGAAQRIMEGARAFHAGRSGLLVIREDDTLWRVDTERFLGLGERIADGHTRLAEGVLTASVGDGADYYVTLAGDLFVKGLAHRGQYGDGRLTGTEDFVQTASEVIQVSSHTGHALVLMRDGSVWGTGGNLYGPLGRHGLGDKATRWGRIFDGATAIATGSAHSLAIRGDRSLWIWGRDEGLDPKRVMGRVTAAAGSKRASVAIAGGALWQWDTGEAPRRVMACE